MRMIALALCSLLISGAAKAQDTQPGGFDYYLLALSWTPNWCAATGDSQGASECARHGLTFSLHGLWPEYEAGGFPSGCSTSAKDPSRSDTAAMEDIMGSAGLAWHEWKTHGRCTGLTSDAYFALMRKAYTALVLPPTLAQVDHTEQVAPKALQDAFLQSNPSLTPQDIAVTCDQTMITEVRICLTKDLAPHPCGAAVHACTLPSAELDAVR